MCLGNEEIRCVDTKEGASHSCSSADQLELDQFMVSSQVYYSFNTKNYEGCKFCLEKL